MLGPQHCSTLWAHPMKGWSSIVESKQHVVPFLQQPGTKAGDAGEKQATSSSFGQQPGEVIIDCSNCALDVPGK